METIQSSQRRSPAFCEPDEPQSAPVKRGPAAVAAPADAVRRNSGAGPRGKVVEAEFHETKQP